MVPDEILNMCPLDWFSISKKGEGYKLILSQENTEEDNNLLPFEGSS